MTEKAFQGAVVEYAVLLGWRCYHTHDSRRSQRGFPDLVLVRGPRILFAELKSETGALRPDQRDWLAALEETRVEVYVWRPDDWSQIIDTLKRPPAAQEAAAA